MPLMDDEKKVQSVFLFALSTCGMCGRVKKLLGELSVKFDFVDVDLLEFEKKENAKKEMRKWNQRCPFPMLIINNSKCVIGDEPELIKQALGK